MTGADPGCGGVSGYYTARSEAICPAGYKTAGAGFLQGTYCPGGLVTGLSGLDVYDSSVAVWPVDNYTYTYIARAKCIK